MRRNDRGKSPQPTERNIAVQQHCEDFGGGWSSTVRSQRAPEPVAKLRQKRQRLLDLYYADQISPTMFAVEEARLTTQIDAQERNAAETTSARQRARANRFERVAAMLRNLDLDRLWEAASDDERHTLVDELVEAVIVYPDRLQVAITGAPPLTVDSRKSDSGQLV